MIEITERRLNYKALEKGDVLDWRALGEVTGLTPSHPQYRTAALKVRDEVWKKRGFTARFEGTAVRILTDREASFYNLCASRLGARRMRLALARSLEVDEARLDPEARLEHRRRCVEQSRVVAAVTHAYKKIRAEAPSRHPRVTPAPAAAKEEDHVAQAA